MKQTPKKIMDRLCEAAWLNWFFTGGRHHNYAPGEFLTKRTTPDEREILKNLKSEDVANYRPFDR